MIDLDRYDHTYARIIRNGDESTVKGPRVYPNTVTLEIKSGQADIITVDTQDSTTLEPVIIVKNKKQRRRQLLNMSKRDSQSSQKSLVKMKAPSPPRLDPPRRVAIDRTTTSASDNQLNDQPVTQVPVTENGITVLYPPSHPEQSATDSGSAKAKKRKSPVKQTEPPKKANKKSTKEAPTEKNTTQETNIKVDTAESGITEKSGAGIQDLTNNIRHTEASEADKNSETKVEPPTKKPKPRPSRGKSKMAKIPPTPSKQKSNKGKNTPKKQQKKASKTKEKAEVQIKKAVSTPKQAPKSLRKSTKKSPKGRKAKSKGKKLQVVLPRSNRASRRNNESPVKSTKPVRGRKKSQSVSAAKIDLDNIVTGPRRRR